ncbi:glutamine synthetase, partial [Candidatus Bathyarchaeota archaeon]|nr:glutamine synthetase [Candidatus Bathyarchaeota archaeon]
MKTQGSTKEDIIKLVQKKDIEILNLCHIPEDCRLKTLSFTAKNKERLHEILEFGERVDGSSLFSYIDPNNSDIYIMPKTETAFINPFNSTPTLNILCKYLDENGKPLDIAPENILLRAEEKLRSSTGITLKALAELEFYIIYKQDETVFQETPERNYHESIPFTKFENLRNEVLITLADVGIATKYGHAEVGRFHSKTGYTMEQHEIEFLPQNLSKMAETVTIAKWIIRNICTKYGVYVSFSPKPALEHAGNGMHIHLYGLKKDKNIITDSKGNLTVKAKQMIGGILKFAPSLTAFGNTTPVSYLRFISRKESPAYICWGTRNRLALIRIPLWWSFRKDIEQTGNYVRTFEFRAPDPSANTYLLLAGIALAVEYGLKNPKKAMKTAEDLNTEKIVKRNRKYKVLPLSCSESAKNLQKDRNHYEADGVFPKRVTDGIISKLESYKDGD